MSGLDAVIPEPQLREVDHVDVAAPPERAWQVIRHGNLSSSPLIQLLFAIRTLPSRLAGREVEPVVLRIGDFDSGDRPGFHILSESDREVVIGAIGKVWHLDIPYADVRTVDAFAQFEEPGYVKVAWALRVRDYAQGQSRIEIEVRVAATDEEARQQFRRYFRVVGPGSHFIRRHALASLARQLGSVEAGDRDRPLAGDDLLPDAAGQMTDAITIHARPDEIWPWLVQMGCDRAGWYSYDLLDNAGVESAREIHPEWQSIQIGDVLPARPASDEGFEVLRLEQPRLLILGGLFDAEAGRQLPFTDSRPDRFWHVTWAFVLDPVAERETRLLVRARAAFPPAGRFHELWIRPVHHFMQAAQLRHLKDRVEQQAKP